MSEPLQVNISPDLAKLLIETDELKVRIRRRIIEMEAVKVDALMMCERAPMPQEKSK